MQKRSNSQILAKIDEKLQTESNESISGEEKEDGIRKMEQNDAKPQANSIPASKESNEEQPKRLEMESNKDDLAHNQVDATGNFATLPTKSSTKINVPNSKAMVVRSITKIGPGNEDKNKPTLDDITKSKDETKPTEDTDELVHKRSNSQILAKIDEKLRTESNESIRGEGKEEAEQNNAKPLVNSVPASKESNEEQPKRLEMESNKDELAHNQVDATSNFATLPTKSSTKINVPNSKAMIVRSITKIGPGNEHKDKPTLDDITNLKMRKSQQKTQMSWCTKEATPKY